jgi:twitching motility protein PilT
MDVPNTVLPKPVEVPATKTAAAAPAAAPARPQPAPSSTAPVPAAAGAAAPIATATIITSMVRAAKGTSDLIFSPFREPQVEVHGQLMQLKIPGVGMLSSEDTSRIAADLIGRNAQALEKLKEQGSCDISYSLPKVSRFRVNIFMQRGSCAIVMRVIPSSVPDFKSLNLPEELGEAAGLRNGIVLVTGPTGSGKSSTLAAILNKINEEKAYHVITIEDPIEFLHSHKRATIHQREVHSDTPSFALALRAALRQAPKVILVGEMRDKETIEVALEAAETGHLVFSTLHTTDASKTVERIIGAFPLGDQNAVRNRLARAFRYIISQRLVPRQDGGGRVAAFEILRSTVRTREYVEKGETEGKSLLDAMRDGETEGMRYFDGELEQLMRKGIVDIETGLSYATNAGNLRLQIADLLESPNRIPAADALGAKPSSRATSELPRGETELEIER